MVWWFVRGLTAVALLVLLFLRVRPVPALRLLRQSNPVFVLAGAALLFAVLVIGNERWRLLLSVRNRPLPRGFLLRVYLAAAALNSVLPTALGGDVLRMAYTAGAGHGSGAVSVVLVDRLIGLIGLLVVTAGASVALAVRDGAPGPVVITVLLAVGLAAVLTAVLIEPSYRRLERFLRRIRLWGLGPKTVAVMDHMRSFRNRGKALMVATGWSLLLWLTHCLVWFTLGRAVGSSTPPFYYLLYVPLVALATMVPVSVGGLGVRENGFVFLMSRAGMAPNQATTIALLYLIVTYFWALVGSLILSGLRRTAHQKSAPRN